MSWSADTPTLGTYGSSNPNTVNHTCSANAKALVVVLFVNGITTRTGGAPTYNGTPMTDSGQGFVFESVSGECGVEIWYLLNPDTGSSYTVSVPNTGAVLFNISVMSFVPTLPVVEFDKSGSHTGTTSSPTVDLTSVSSNTVIIGGLGTGERDVPSAGSTAYTLVHTYDAGNQTWGSEYDLTGAAGTVTVNFQLARSDDWGIIGISISEKAGAFSVNKSESISVGESLTVSVSSPIISVSDSLNLSESATAEIVIDSVSINVSESISAGESISENIVSEVSTNESLAVSDYPSYYQDEIIVTETVSVSIFDDSLTVNVSESVTSSDTPVVALQSLQINVSDSIGAADTPTASVSVQVSTADSLTAGDIPSVLVVSAISASDSVSLTDTPTVDVRAAWYNPDSITVNTGSIVSGTIEDTWSDNGVKLQLAETTGSPAFSYDFYFYDVPATAYNIKINGYYNGNPAHQIKIQQYNFTTTGWTNLSAEDTDFPSDTSDQNYTFAIFGGVNYVQSGEVRIRIVHNTAGNINHNFYIDEMVMGQLPVVHANESITVTDTPALALADLAASASDSTTVGESRTVVLPNALEVSAQDGVTLSETVDVTVLSAGTLAASTSDSITASESSTLEIQTTISVSDGASIADDPTVSVQVAGTLSVSVSDSISVSESIVVYFGLEISSADSVSLADSSTTLLPDALSASVSDSLSVGESVTVAVLQAGAIAVTVSDTVNLSELVEGSISLSLDISDSISVSESINQNILTYVSVSDSLSVSESSEVSLPDALQVSNSENISVSENYSVTVSAVGSLDISTADSLTVSESTLIENIFGITITDSVTLSESIITILPDSLTLSSSDSISISDSDTVRFWFATTPDKRIYSVNSEDRVISIKDDDRTLSVPGDSRVYSVNEG